MPARQPPLSRALPMPKGKSLKSLEFIKVCKHILEDIHPASIRAVAYQLFIKKLLPDMSKTSTNKVSAQLVDARELDLGEAYQVPWEWIVDDTREEERAPVWSDVDELLEWAEKSYRRDYWLGQPRRVGVWSEKATVRGTLAPVLDRYHVPFLPIHGHNSATEVKRQAQRQQQDPRTWVVFYVGDWDPSGMDMSERDLPERMRRYGATE